MPADLRHQRARPQRRSSFPLRPRTLFLLVVFLLAYTAFSAQHDLPPWSWYEDWVHRHDKVVKHRPAFKKVERYSPEHRYRPAASPIIKRVGKDGRIEHHGQYH